MFESDDMQIMQVTAAKLQVAEMISLRGGEINNATQPQGGTVSSYGGSVWENFRLPTNISLASSQPKNISSFYTLTPENEHEISGSNANKGHECL